VTDYVAGGRAESAIPRTTDARNAREVSALVRGRRGASLSIWGMAMFVASETTLFGAFIGTYYYLRFKTVHWPPLGTPQPEVVIPLILVAVLSTTSVPMQLAVFAARAGRLWSTRLLIGLALLVQSGYFGYEVHDLQHQLQTSQPQDNAYSSIYYVLLGADHAHVFLGLLLNLWLLWKLAKGLTMYRLNALQAVTFYWHAVNVITWLVIGTLLSAAV
jgi:heme/copper-type cytochrome/quinol oxidase subunit 3